jgi:diguanylate cyclase (GGDEF)-like protein
MTSVGSRERWLVALLIAVLALPIIGITLYFTYNVQRRIAFAGGERSGLAHVALLDAFLADASLYANAVACPGSHRDLASLRERADASLERIEAFQIQANTPPRWAEVHSAWEELRTTVRPPLPAANLIEPLAASFGSVSDDSGITFDPEIEGIDIGDSLTYRLPRAIAEFQMAARALCGIPSAPTIAQRVLIEQHQARGEQLAADAFQDIDDALQRGDANSLLAVSRAYVLARHAVSGASDAVDTFIANGTPADRARAQASLNEVATSLHALIRTEIPAVDERIKQRVAGYQRELLISLIPGIIGLLATLAIALLTLRLLWERAAHLSAELAAAENERIAMHDSLTGLLNRRAFFAALEGSPHSGVLCLLDVDDFKGINDTFGHLTGDNILIRLARIVEASVRSTDVVARIGGDEFALFLRSPIDRQGVIRVLETITMDAAAPVRIRDRTVRSSVSVGGAFIRDLSELSVEDALGRADSALYEAKAKARGRFVIADEPSEAPT